MYRNHTLKNLNQTGGMIASCASHVPEKTERRQNRKLQLSGTRKQRLQTLDPRPSKPFNPDSPLRPRAAPSRQRAGDSCGGGVSLGIIWVQGLIIVWV